MTPSHSWFVLHIEKPGLAGNFLMACGEFERVEFENRMFSIDVAVDEIAAGGRTRGGTLRIEYNDMPVFGLT